MRETASVVQSVLIGTVLTASAALCVTAIRAEEPVRLYVATKGNDAWSGRLAAPNADHTDGPLASLDRARDAIRQDQARLARCPKEV